MRYRDYLKQFEGLECELSDSDSAGYIAFFGHRTPSKNSHKCVEVHEDYITFSQKDFPSETAIPFELLRIIRNA